MHCHRLNADRLDIIVTIAHRYASPANWIKISHEGKRKDVFFDGPV